MRFLTWRFILVLLMVVLMVACSLDEVSNLAIPSVDDAGSDRNYFPLADGAYWIYQGKVTWEDNGEVKSENLEWKMEVVEVIDRGDIIGYRMLGYPGDLAWYEEGKERSQYAILQAGSGSYYLSELDALERLKDNNDLLGFLVSEGQILLNIPLSNGKRFCEAEFITNPYGDYCWVVGLQEKVDLDKVIGVDSREPVDGFPIRYVTNPDHTVITFVPGVGITHYVYGHHGVLSEVDLQLIEYSNGR